MREGGLPAPARPDDFGRAPLPKQFLPWGGGGGGGGGGGVTRSREHYSDARGGTRQSTLNRGSVGERGRGGAEKGLGSEGVHMRKLSINPPNYIKG